MYSTSVPALTAKRVTADSKATALQKHSERAIQKIIFQSAMVGRLLTSKEARENPKAVAAVKKECDKLEHGRTWLLESVREWRDVRREATEKGEEVHVGRVVPICAEKFSVSRGAEGDERQAFLSGERRPR